MNTKYEERISIIRVAQYERHLPSLSVCVLLKRQADRCALPTNGCLIKIRRYQI